MMKKTILSIFIVGLCILPISAQTASATTDYSDARIQDLKLGSQAWTFRNFSFYEMLDMMQDLDLHYLEAYPGQVLDKKSPYGQFSHNMSDDQMAQVKQALKDHDIKLMCYGVVGFENNEESTKEVFEFAKKMGIRTIVTEPKYDDYSIIEKMVKKYNIQVAIHNHPYPSKYAYPQTVLDHIRGLDERIGACADIGHWMRTGLNVVESLRMLEGRILDVHFEDLDEIGSKKANTVPFGQGEANVHDALAELTRQNFYGMLAMELEQGKVVKNPVPTIREGKKYVEKITHYKDWHEILVQGDNGRFNKHGWNHYGPGYFELDHKTGVLKSKLGMGLFWYAKEMLSDFTLDLEFMVDQERSNSGIFLRIPGVPYDNYYVGHSFEVQIYHLGDGIHQTGAIYDAEPPLTNATKGSGEWNHYSITFKGDTIIVYLNGVKVQDWKADPRGKIKDFAEKGYIGLQNHDRETAVFYRNIFLKELD
jgi:sugar phosphate isomerase/epimerase